MPPGKEPLTRSRNLALRIARGPCCPCCGETGFDDWHREPSLERIVGGVAGELEEIIFGRLRCHGCGKFFRISHYADGWTHCSVWRNGAGRSA